MTETMRPDDAIKYAAALLKERTEWTLDSIGGSMCDQRGHERELDAIDDVVKTICTLAAQFGDPNRYADGRMVKSHAQIQHGLSTSQIWHPDPSCQEPRSWRSSLPSDPGVPSPGIFEVTTDPATQQIHTRVVTLTESPPRT